jgi:hypothetical protein
MTMLEDFSFGLAFYDTRDASLWSVALMRVGGLGGSNRYGLAGFQLN